VRDEITAFQDLIAKNPAKSKPFYRSSVPIVQEIHSVASYTEIEDNVIYVSDQSVFTGPETKIAQTQTISTIIFIEKVARKRIFLGTDWKKCAILGVEFAFILPWV
jgi:hypothetical protein